MDCEKRWKQHRDKYVREKKKTKGKSGDAGPAVVSCWPLFQVMEFLKETIKHKILLLLASIELMFNNILCSTATNFSASQAITV